jgi:L-serine dehydratase
VLVRLQTTAYNNSVNTSLFELFKIGIGPSSSHTVGPMRAALRFVRELEAACSLENTTRVTVDLYGSLALTGIGHGTDRAVLLGLMGEAPDSVDPATVEAKIAEVRGSSRLRLGGRVEIPFREVSGSEDSDLRFRRAQMYPEAGVVSHPNGMRFTAFDAAGTVLASDVFYSVGGGFIVSEAERIADAGGGSVSTRVVPYPYRSAAELLRIAGEHQLTIAELVLANECALLADERVHIVRPGPDTAARSSEDRVRGSVMTLWRAMEACAQRGMEIEGILPGGLKVRRRAPGLATAPTNGAAGVIPAIALYYLRFVCEGCSDAEKEAGLLRYFLTAAAIGILYKENASISGAEVGCQGEVGVACSMAAGGLVAAQHGTNGQVEHAAEIAMEHNLGMTCDPIGGLVQIPCIERNGMGAVKAINASRIAMHEMEEHKLSLDQIIKTMYETGMDMQSRYKETSLAGLALNVIEC